MAITTSTTLEIESPPVAERRHVAVSDEPLSRTVYGALADAEGVDPTDLDFELYRSVDVDALDALYRHTSSRASAASDPDPRGGWTFSFEVDEYQVAVESDGRVAVYETA